ncbi:MAG: TetR/AcrR family transcriptional regulator [Pseudomonadota bacterium]
MDTRDQLLDSAERLARSRGYDAFSYADLSAEVGIRKASIHHHFPTKADLALALVDRYREGVALKLETAAKTAKTGAQRVAGFIATYRQAMNGGHSLCLCVAFSAGRESLSEPVLASLNQFNEDTTAWLREAYTLADEDGSIAGLGEIAAEAAATLALVEGAQLIARAASDVSPFDQATHSLESRLT